MSAITKLGSLYFGGQPQKPGVAYNGELLSFGATVAGYEIQWIRLKSGLLVADRCVCTSIS